MKKKYISYWPYAAIIAGTIGLLIRSRFSFNWSDESYYLSLVHRLWNDGKPIAEEWSGVQFYATIFLPFYSLYLKMVGSTEGIVLAARVFMIICGGVLSLYLYKSLANETAKIPALLGALFFLLYVRANIMGISYYSTALFFYTWGIFWLFNTKETKRNWFRFLVAGILFAFAALAVPHLLIVYVMCFAGVLCIKKFQRYRGIFYGLLLGMVLVFGGYLCFIFSRISLAEFFSFAKNILKDPEHGGNSLWLSIPLWFARVGYRYIYTITIVVASVLYDRYKRRRHGSDSHRNVLIVVNFTVFLINAILSYSVVGGIYIALSILGLQFMSMYEKNEKIDCMLKIFISGIIFSMIFHMASNTGLDAMTTGFCICATVIPSLLWELVDINKEKLPQWVGKIIMAVLVIVLVQMSCLRIFSVYRDDCLKNLTTEIEEGPAKGLYTTELHCLQYLQIIDDIEKMQCSGEDQVVFGEMIPWAYLCVESDCAAPSSCRFWAGLEEERLKMYYTQLPEQFPEYIFVAKPEYGACRSVIIQDNERIEQPNGAGLLDWLITYATEHGYSVREFDSAVIAVAPGK